MEEIIKEQAEFIEFLKRNNLYRTLETTNVMQKMFELWKATKREVEHQKHRKPHDLINTHCHYCLEEGTYDRIKEDSKLKIVITGNGTNVGFCTYYICHDCYKEHFGDVMWGRL